MSRARQLYELRFYEGEHLFICECGGTYVTYTFEGEPNEFLDHQKPPLCSRCGLAMEWAGWAGQSDITQGIVKLVEDGHPMAAIVILAAFVEYQIDNVLWAILVDTGLPRAKASGIANGTLPRGDAIRMIRNLLGVKVGNIVFPIRNEVAHGRAFGRATGEYIDAIDSQLEAIEKWVDSIAGKDIPSGYDFTELDRWILSMGHWVYWIKDWRSN